MNSCALSLQTCKCQLFLGSYHTRWLYGGCVQPRIPPYKCWDFNDVISSQSLWFAAFLLNISMSDGSRISIRGKSNLFQSMLSDPIGEELKPVLMLAAQLSVVSPKLWNVAIFSRQSIRRSLVAGSCRAWASCGCLWTKLFQFDVPSLAPCDRWSLWIVKFI